MLFAGASPVSAAVFTVANYNDSGPGSLRQAIFDANASPGADVIQIAIVGTAPRVISVKDQFLPPLMGPLVLRVGTTAPSANAPAVTLDGASLVPPRTPAACPGATVVFNAQTQQWDSSRVQGTGPNVRGYYGAGLTVIDSKDVEISGLEIRNFCIGIATVRSSNVNVHDVRIVDAHGAAGVIFTGDDGQAGSTELSFANRLTHSVLLDNGDGFEFTRGTHHSLIEGNLIALTKPLPSDGNAVEFATAGSSNSVIGNTFTGYVSTAMTVGSGGSHTIRGNTITGNRGTGMSVGGSNNVVEENRLVNNGGAGATVGGTGHKIRSNVFSGNGGAGLQVSGQGITVSRNAIFANGGLGIDLNPPGANVHDGPAGCVDHLADCDTGANNSQNTPILGDDSLWTSAGLVVRGRLESRPNQAYNVELFASRAASPGLTEPQPGVGGGGAGRGGAPDPGTATATAAATGDGERFIGSVSVTTDATGSGAFSVTLPGAGPFAETPRQPFVFVAATATDAAGNTSEFSPSVLLLRR